MPHTSRVSAALLWLLLLFGSDLFVRRAMAQEAPPPREPAPRLSPEERQIRRLTTERNRLVAEIESLRAQLSAAQTEVAKLRAASPEAVAPAQEWNVEIVFAAETPTEMVEQEVEIQQEAVKSATSELEAARRQVEALQRQKAKGAQVLEARKTLDARVKDRDRARMALEKAERALRQAKASRTVTARLADGSAAEVVTLTEATSNLADAMKPGERYRVMGNATTSGGVLRIELTGATHLDDAPANLAPATKRAGPGTRKAR